MKPDLLKKLGTWKMVGIILPRHPKSLRLRIPEYFSLDFFPRSFCLYLSTCVVSFLGRIFLNECALAGLPRDTVKSQIDVTVSDEEDSFEHPLGIRGQKR